VPLRIVQVDAFTSAPFAGNPAGVCVLPAFPEARWMQDVAAEMNLSETAFVAPRDGDWDLRWFTPTTEVDLCGHATLASAHVLWQDGHLPADAAARFHTHSGPLTARRAGDWIELDFPAEPPAAVEPAPGLVEALGVAPVATARNRLDWLVEVASAEAVRAATPDLGRLARVPGRGVIVTARADVPGYDFVSRFFGPAVGVDEDPVTGSAHCGLAPYWGPKLGRREMTGLQVSRRGGVVRVRLAGERVVLAGQAVTVMTGELRV
jgi:PhzF family phenazine biosynthesis protein